jgi:imidazolonepropionase-like amidohydrolase
VAVPTGRHTIPTPSLKLRAGFAADLTVLKGDPSTDVRALAAVQYTIRDGKIIYRSN